MAYFFSPPCHPLPAPSLCVSTHPPCRALFLCLYGAVESSPVFWPFAVGATTLVYRPCSAPRPPSAVSTRLEPLCSFSWRWSSVLHSYNLAHAATLLLFSTLASRRTPPSSSRQRILLRPRKSAATFPLARSLPCPAILVLPGLVPKLSLLMIPPGVCLVLRFCGRLPVPSPRSPPSTARLPPFLSPWRTHWLPINRLRPFSRRGHTPGPCFRRSRRLRPALSLSARCCLFL